MKSKNKKLFLKIYIPFVIIISIALIVLQILASKNRIGYLTDFNLNIDRTLELNNLNDIREEFTIGGKSDEESITNQVRKMKYFDFKNIDKAEIDEEGIKNYIFTNENITNYVHHFKIKYYDKVFRNNDIYGVYPDLSNLPDYMENAEMDEGGSPYGNFISDKKMIEEEKIDNINYILKIKINIIEYVIYLILILLIIYTKIYFENIKIFFNGIITVIKIKSNMDMATEIANFYMRNKKFFRDYDPFRPESFYNLSTHKKIVKKELEETKLGRMLKFWIFKIEDKKRIIGMISFTNISNSSFLSTTVGYKLDEEELKQGYMTEALRAAIVIIFKELKLHRIEANIMPHNRPSMNLVKKLGFEYEGLAKKYLKINGKWEDHIHMTIINKDEV